jgi:hypothetical protein
MASPEKSTLYQARKASGVPLTRPYVEYTIDQLKAELAELQQAPEPEVVTVDLEGMAQAYQALIAEESPEEARPEPPEAPVEPLRANAPDPREMPSQRLNTAAEDEVIRIDDEGRHWIQEEVRKPAYPKPRGRRVLKYMEKGVETKTVQNGEYVETFEVAGEGVGKPAEVKITLPSYQVGIYRDRRFPFKVITYDGRSGFALEDVQAYYGGSELVPAECKRTYIENVLCYDVRSVIRAIQNEHRHLQLTGRLK